MEDTRYQLDPVSVTRVASEDIDSTFRSSCIGKSVTYRGGFIGRLYGADLTLHAKIPTCTPG